MIGPSRDDRASGGLAFIVLFHSSATAGMISRMRMRVGKDRWPDRVPRASRGTLSH